VQVWKTFIFKHSTVSDRLPRFITQKTGFKTEEYPPLTPCDMTVGQFALERVELSAGVQSIWLQNIQVYTFVTWSRHWPVVQKWWCWCAGRKLLPRLSLRSTAAVQYTPVIPRRVLVKVVVIFVVIWINWTKSSSKDCIGYLTYLIFYSFF
jgi:hypothetical protein